MAFLLDKHFKRMGRRMEKVIEAEEKAIKSQNNLIKAIEDHKEVMQELIDVIKKL